MVRVDAESLAAAADQIRKSTAVRNVVVLATSQDHLSDLLLPGSEFANAVGDTRVPVFPIAGTDKDALLAQLKRITVELRNQYVLE